MNDNENKEIQSQLSPKTEELLKAETRNELEDLDRMSEMQKEHSKEMQNMRDSLNKTLDQFKVIAGDNEKIKNDNLKKDREIMALQEALMNQKKMNTMTEKERYMSEGERIGMKALEIIDKRLEERYGKK